MATRDITVHQHHLTAGRHIYPALVIAQFLHGFEDYVAGFHETFPLYSLAPEFFVLLHLGLVLLLAALIPSVAHGRSWALRLAKLWAVLEILNGAFHLMLALIEWEYYPGVWTAPLLLIFGAALGRSLRS
ncbi:MAG: HXXEE domain-containing protein [Gemmatimonadota bacterium]|nr:MAG: HXXEE domain-containing protein [Gemmatimonadota bacterium]